MSKIARRTLARYAVDQLLAGKSSRRISKELAAVIIDSGQDIEPEFLLGDIAWELERRRELAIGRVTSAHELTDQIRAELSSRLKKATGTKEVLLEEQLDKLLIGGVRVETANRVW